MKYDWADFVFEWRLDFRVNATCCHCGAEAELPQLESDTKQTTESRTTVLVQHGTLCTLAKAAAGAS